MKKVTIVIIIFAIIGIAAAVIASVYGYKTVQKQSRNQQVKPGGIATA